MRISSIGHGAGDRDFPQHANVLRALIGERISAPEATLVSVIEANIDDSSPQVLGYALDRLMEAGALDVSLSPIQMKKNRPGSLLRVIARPEDQERLAQVIFAETSTLGLRIHAAERRVEERRMVEVETPWGSVRGKVSGEVSGPGLFAPEYEDCRAIAERTRYPAQAGAGRGGRRLSKNEMKYYLTTPIYYTNAAPHIGHAYTTIAADTIRRMKQMQGYDVTLATGTDEHGVNVERAALAAGKTPQEYTDVIAEEFRNQWQILELGIDRFQRTTGSQSRQSGAGSVPALQRKRLCV